MKLPAPDTAHAWIVRLDLNGGDLTDAASLLSADERERAARFHFERDRQRYIAAHAALRVVLARYLAASAAQLPIGSTENRKPRIELDHVPLDFNLSHSADRAVIAVSATSGVGADIERLRPVEDAAQIAKRFFSPAEAAALATEPEARQARAFLECWTRKEAFVKAGGHGLAYPLDRFTVSLGLPARLEDIAGDRAAAAQWSLLHFEPEPDYIGAVALPRAGCQLELRWYSPDHY